jgi:recombinational DNA repair protein RecT
MAKKMVLRNLLFKYCILNNHWVRTDFFIERNLKK